MTTRPRKGEMMEKYEYNVIAIREGLHKPGLAIVNMNIINEKGGDGWELVAVYDQQAFFKRRK